MQYEVTHKYGVDIIEADSYRVEGLCTARKVTGGRVVKNVLLVDLITRINEELEKE